MLSLNTADCTHENVNVEVLFAPLLQGQDCPKHLSFLKYWGLQEESHILLKGKSAHSAQSWLCSALVTLQRNSRQTTFFVCLLVILSLKSCVAVICLQLTWTQSDYKSLFEEAIVWLFSSKITVKEPAQVSQIKCIVTQCTKLSLPWLPKVPGQSSALHLWWSQFSQCSQISHSFPNSPSQGLRKHLFCSSSRAN